MKKLLPLLVLLASACNPCTKLPLSADDRAWTGAYPRVGQEIAFRSDRGHAATYRVAERVDTYNNLDCNWLEIGSDQPAHFHLTLRLTAFPQGGARDLTLYVVKWSAQQPAQLDFRMAGLEAYFHERDDHHHFRLLPRACTLASGQRFPQAYYFEAGRNAIAYGAPPLRAWYWDPQAGLLRYELIDGEVFELVPAGQHQLSDGSAG
ncbi:hypothetical protein [Hymenobacter bucti]|uniref:Lipoprotein n=1 Tax=Hymenobacter bucti TaxID=1844114 RepID=A0ABW4QZU7_9BACT